MQDLRDALFETLEGVKSGKLDVEKAKAITSIAQVLVNSAKVEVDFLKNVNATGSTGFISGEVKKLNGHEKVN